MAKKSVLAMLAAAGVLAAGAAVAADSNLYLLGNIGRSNISANGTDIDALNVRNGFASSSTAVGDGDTAYKVQLGYRISNMYAIEGGYTGLGKVGFNSTTNLGVVPGHFDADVLNLDAVGLVPMGQNLGLLARIGVYRWDAKSTIPALAGGTTQASDTGWDIKFGVGLQYDFNKNFAMRAEFERFNGVGDSNTTGDSKINMYSVGVVLKF